MNTSSTARLRRSPSRATTGEARILKARRRTKDAKWAAIFLAPAIIAILTMRVAPTLEAFSTSLYKGFPGGIVEPVFNGFNHYQDLWESEAFRKTLLLTLIFNLIINPLQISISLLLAVVMTRKIKLAGLWRTLVFVPATVPIVGSSILWGIALQPHGPVNSVIQALGGEPQGFLTSPDQALASVILIASWIGVGYWMLFLISGIQNIPADYYEAARLDRAGAIRTFFSITLPLLKRPLLFVLVADTVANFVLFVPFQILTDGGPAGSTNVLMFDAYRQTFGYSQKYLGAAEIVVLLMIMLIFVALQFWLLREDSSPRRRRK